MQISEIVELTNTYYCLDCGVCTGSCPVAKVFSDFSPRRIIERSLYELEDFSDQSIWYCLGCAQCSVRCPAKIEFPEFIRLMRKEAYSLGFWGSPAHNGVFQTIMSIQTSDIKQNRLFWAEDNDLKTSEKGEFFYFVGCRPYFDVIFQDIGVKSLEVAKKAIKILNMCGIEPVLSNEERCCGHDALWDGDEKTFKELASKNIELIKECGAKKVIFSCPEGYYTFKKLYPIYFGELPFEPVYILNIIMDALRDGKISFKESQLSVTYQDPCNLGRLSGMFDLPRDIIKSIPMISFYEMPRSKENAVCCGTTGWMNCSSISKQIQVSRLNEAIATGANILVTACPKCEIHFKCTKSAFEIGDIEIKDILDLIFDQIKEGKDEG